MNRTVITVAAAFVALAGYAFWRIASGMVAGIPLGKPDDTMSAANPGEHVKRIAHKRR